MNLKSLSTSNYRINHEWEGEEITSWISVEMESEKSVKISFKSFPIIVDEPGPEDPAYGSKCPVLDLESQGENYDDAVCMIKDAIHAFLVSCLECDCLDMALKDLGFKAVEEDSKPSQRFTFSDSFLVNA